ncbi:hypothetical protein NMG60_11028373 [Bertholletia excelsa]
MDNHNQKSKPRKIPRWFKRKQERSGPFSPHEFADWDDDEGNKEQQGVPFRSMQDDPCVLTNELRVFVGTWNVDGRSPTGSLAVDVDEWLNLKEAADIYVLGFQEIVPLIPTNVIGAEDQTEATNWNLLIGKTLNDRYGCPWLTPMLTTITSDDYQYGGVSDTYRRSNLNSQTASKTSKYKLMASKKMVGVFITAWMKRELIRKYRVSNVKVCSVACGIMGYLGNKGSISVSMSIEGTSFCFVNAHLASGEKRGNEGRRNHQVTEIFRRTYFPWFPEDDDSTSPLTILGHDRVFWFGDLNYRLYFKDNSARQLIEKQDWVALQEFDQLQRELENGGVFQGWKEGNIDFAPTYKYSSSNRNRYSGGLPSKAGEKQRTPAWCDRILWYGKGVRQLSYFRSESKFSDHRPVSALFSTQIEVVKSITSKVFPLEPIIPALPPQQTAQGTEKEEVTSTLLSLIARDAEASPSHLEKKLQME